MLIIDEKFDDQTYTGQELSRGGYDNCTFDNCHFEQADLAGINFTECNFTMCHFGNATLDNVGFKNVVFEGCNFLGTDFTNCSTFLLKMSFDKLDKRLYRKGPSDSTVNWQAIVQSINLSDIEIMTIF